MPTEQKDDRFILQIAEAAEKAGMGVAVLLADQDPPVPLYMSPVLQAMVGMGLEDIQKESVWVHFAEPALSELRDSYRRRALGDKAPRVLETVFQTRDGERIPLELFSSVVETDGRRLLVVFFRDISYRKQAEEALRRSESRFRTLVEHAPDGIAILRSGKVVFINPVAARMLGVTDAEAIYSRPITDFLVPQDAERTLGRLAQIEQTGRPFREPSVYRSRDIEGRLKTVEVVSIPIDYDGEMAVLGFARDVTEREAMQAKLIESDRLAAIGTLAAGVAHEINNPLTYVTFNLERISRQMAKLECDLEARGSLLRHLEHAIEGVLRVCDIVRDLQLFAKPNAEEMEPVDLRAVLESVLRFARPTLSASADIVCRWQDAPPVEGNKQRFEQLFLNLILNAADALPTGQPDRHRITLSLGPNEDGRVVAEVQDTGVGIRAEDMARIFDPFFTTKAPGKGTGLGLFVCRAIVESFGGTITVHSQPGQGTIFRVSLKACDPAPA